VFDVTASHRRTKGRRGVSRVAVSAQRRRQRKRSAGRRSTTTAGDAFTQIQTSSAEQTGRHRDGALRQKAVDSRFRCVSSASA